MTTRPDDGPDPLEARLARTMTATADAMATDHAVRTATVLQRARTIRRRRTTTGLVAATALVAGVVGASQVVMPTAGTRRADPATTPTGSVVEAWVASLPPADLSDLPVIGGAEGAPTLSYQGRTTALPTEVVGVDRWWPTPSGLVLQLRTDRSVVDPSSGVAVRVDRDGSVTSLLAGVATMAVSPDGTQVVSSVGPRYAAASRYVIVDVATGESRPETGPELPPQMAIAAWGPGGVVLPSARGLTVWRPGGARSALTADTVGTSPDGRFAVVRDGATCLLDLTTGDAVPGTPCGPAASPPRTFTGIGPAGRWVIARDGVLQPTSSAAPHTVHEGVHILGAEHWLSEDEAVLLVMDAAPQESAVEAWVRCTLTTMRCHRVSVGHPIFWLPGWPGIDGSQVSTITEGSNAARRAALLRWYGSLPFAPSVPTVTWVDSAPSPTITLGDRVMRVPDLMSVTAWRLQRDRTVLAAFLRAAPDRAPTAPYAVLRVDGTTSDATATLVATSATPAVLSRDGARAAVVAPPANGMSRIRVIDTATGSTVAERELPGVLTDLSEAGVVASILDRKGVVVWDPDTGRVRRYDGAVAADVSAEPSTFAVRFAGGCAHVIDLVRDVTSPGRACAVHPTEGKLSPDGRYLLAPDGTLVDLTTGQTRRWTFPSGVRVGDWSWAVGTRVSASVSVQDPEQPVLDDTQTVICEVTSTTCMRTT